MIMKTIFITGASSGIGRETTKYFANHGWRVIATMRNPQKAGELADLPKPVRQHWRSTTWMCCSTTPVTA